MTGASSIRSDLGPARGSGRGFFVGVLRFVIAWLRATHSPVTRCRRASVMRDALRAACSAMRIEILEEHRRRIVGPAAEPDVMAVFREVHAPPALQVAHPTAALPLELDPEPMKATPCD